MISNQKVKKIFYWVAAVLILGPIILFATEIADPQLTTRQAREIFSAVSFLAWLLGTLFLLAGFFVGCRKN